MKISNNKSYIDKQKDDVLYQLSRYKKEINSLKDSIVTEGISVTPCVTRGKIQDQIKNIEYEKINRYQILLDCIDEIELSNYRKLDTMRYMIIRKNIFKEIEFYDLVSLEKKLYGFNVIDEILIRQEKFNNRNIVEMLLDREYKTIDKYYDLLIGEACDLSIISKYKIDGNLIYIHQYGKYDTSIDILVEAVGNNKKLVKYTDDPDLYVYEIPKCKDGVYRTIGSYYCDVSPKDQGFNDEDDMGKLQYYYPTEVCIDYIFDIENKQYLIDTIKLKEQ